MMFISVVVRSFLAFPVLLTVLTTITTKSCLQTNALPITSKPIENTAENLAWQAWLRLPPEQKSLEKSRKVTPKSIFTLPNRQCPEGQVISGAACIPKVEINKEQLVEQVIFDFLGLNADNTKGDYDYGDFGDAEDTTGTGTGTGGDDFKEPVEVQYDAPQKFSGSDFLNFGSSESNNNNTNSNAHPYDDGSAYQLPTRDEPLKFNIFQQFPTDYSEDPFLTSGLLDESVQHEEAVEPLPQATNVGQAGPQQNLSALQINGQLLFDAVAKNLSKTPGNETQDKLSQILPSNDMQTSSSNESVTATLPASSSEPGLAAANTATTAEAAGPSDGTVFPFGNIDAIILPALPTQNSASDNNGGDKQESSDANRVNGKVDLESAQVTQQKLHKISLFKDDSALQLVTVAARPTITATATAAAAEAASGKEAIRPTVAQDKQSNQAEHSKNNNDTKKIDLAGKGEAAVVTTSTTATTTTPASTPITATTTTTTTQEPMQAMQADLGELLKAEALLPFSPNLTQAAATADEAFNKTKPATASTPTVIEMSTTLTPPSSKSQSELVLNDGPSIAVSGPQGSSNMLLEGDLDLPVGDEVTDMMMLADSDIVEMTTMLPPLLIDRQSDTAASEELVAHVVEGQAAWGSESSKDERTRSIATTPAAAGAMEAQEIGFTTTLEPLTTTNTQLDDTTIIETAPGDLPELELLEAQQNARAAQGQQQQPPELSIYPPEHSTSENSPVKIVKKSKVEPVELPAVDFVVSDEAEMPTSPLTASSVTLTATPSPIFKAATTTTTTKAITEATTTTTAEPTPKASATSSDRFVAVSLPANKLGVVVGSESNKSEDKITDGNNQKSNDNAIVNSDTKPDSQAQRNTVAAENLGTPALEDDVKATTVVASKDEERNQELRMINGLGEQRQQYQEPKPSTVAVDSKSESSAAMSLMEKTEASARSALPETEESNKSSTQAEPAEIAMASEEVSLGETSSTETSPTTAKTSTTTRATGKAASVATTTASAWSKIMPSFDASVKPLETATKRNELASSIPADIGTSSKTSSKSLMGKSSSEEQLKGSPRNIGSYKNSIDSSNSKIVKINSLSALKEDIPPESSEIIEHESLSKALLARLSESEAATASDAVPNSPTSQTTSAEFTPTTTTTTTPMPTTKLPLGTEATSNRNREPHSLDAIEPFWWLPIGWHIDSDAEVKSQESESASFASDFQGGSHHAVPSSSHGNRQRDSFVENSVLLRFLNALNGK